MKTGFLKVSRKQRADRRSSRAWCQIRVRSGATGEQTGQGLRHSPPAPGASAAFLLIDGAGSPTVLPAQAFWGYVSDRPGPCPGELQSPERESTHCFV